MSIFTDSKEFLRDPAGIIKDRFNEVFVAVSAVDAGLSAMKDTASKMTDNGTFFRNRYNALTPNVTINHDIVSAGLAAMEVEKPKPEDGPTISPAEEGVESARANVEAAFKTQVGA